MLVAVAAAILGATTIWVLAPLFGWGRGEEPEGDARREREELLESRRQTLAAIKDLEMEFHTGKLTREDFEQTREKMAREAIEILKRIDAGAGALPAAPGGQDGR